MNFLKRGVIRLWVSCWLKFRIYRTKWILCQVRENFTILKQRAGLERLHGMLWVLQETFLNDYLLEKDTPLLSSTHSKNLAHPSLKLGPDVGGNTKRLELEMTRTAKLVSSCTTAGMYDHTGGTSILPLGWLEIRDFQSRKCIQESSFQTLWNFKVGMSTSRLIMFV